MTVQHSFSKIEKELLPAFRQQIGSAESTEDVRKYFIYTVQDLVKKATEGELEPRYEDISLNHSTECDDDCQYVLGADLTANELFSGIWENSDLQRIVAKFAASACNRYKHLEKKPEKTDAKIRMV